MKPIRIFRHLACEGPGYLGEFLDRHGAPWELLCIDEGHPVPEAVKEVSGLVFMGAAVSVNDDLPWLADELALIRRAHEAGVPMMGVCFGGQLISKALGGEVTRGAGMEIGWHPLEPVDGEPLNGAADGWLDGLPARFDTFHWHADTFSFPPGSLPLLRSRCYRNQAYALGDHLGMQFHLEMTREMLERWLARYGSDLDLGSPCAQSLERITDDIDGRMARLHRVADALYGAWLTRVRAAS
ncbi:type 1 glutamine amidotransferase [Endothiovibrio diazotrophicus]